MVCLIKAETEWLLQSDVIESSRCPWRVQVLVVSHGRKKRLVIDYSSTVNHRTGLDV